MKIIYFGHTQRGIRCLEALHHSSHSILLAVALETENQWYTSVRQTAESLGIPVVVTEHPNDPGFIGKIEGLQADLGIIVGYSKYVGKRLRDSFRHGMINLHASHLPDYRGAAPLNWAIIRGETHVGLSIYFIDSGIDTGPILKQKIIPVGPDDTINDVIAQSLEAYPAMLVEACNEIETGQFNAAPQDLDAGSYFTKRKPQDGQITWDRQSDAEIHNLVRGLTLPYPGAFFFYRNRKVFVWETRLEKKNYMGIPGRVATRKGGGIVVIARNKGVRLIRVQAEGEPVMPAEELFTVVGEDLL